MADKAEKKKSSKKAGNGAVFYDVVMQCATVVVKEGVVSSSLGKAIMLNTKRDGSSLRQKIVVPKDKIIFVEGSLSEGSEAKITYRSDLAPIGRKMRRVEVDETVDKETGLLKGKNEKGVNILIHPEYSVIVTAKESVVDAPAGTTVKKKKPASK